MVFSRARVTSLWTNMSVSGYEDLRKHISIRTRPRSGRKIESIWETLPSQYIGRWYGLFRNFTSWKIVLSKARSSRPDSRRRLKTVYVCARRNYAVMIDAQLMCHANCSQTIDADRRCRVDVEDLGLARRIFEAGLAIIAEEAV